MRIDHEENKNKGGFYVEENGKRLAELLYFRPSAGKINIYHTEVSETLRGKGVGGELVAAAVKYARANDLKIIASCPYTEKIIDKTPEYGDLLTEE
jgi:predicted GNAT family acetyltransferase